jgi:hypothetical protein
MLKVMKHDFVIIIRIKCTYKKGTNVRGEIHTTLPAVSYVTEILVVGEHKWRASENRAQSVYWDLGGKRRMKKITQ